jgi:hypothetical protein
MNAENNAPGEGSARGAERRLKARLILKLLRRRAGRLLLSLLILVVLFAGMGALQHWSVQDQLRRATKRQLALWANQVVNEIAYKDKWVLVGYRRASISAPSWMVVAADGLLIDIEGFTPGVLGPAQMPNESLFASPQTIATPLGETWRLFAKKLQGGTVVLGSESPENLATTDTKLLANADKFGSTLDKATSTSSREVDSEIDYVVLTDKGDITAAWGGVPLQTEPRSLPGALDQLSPLVVDGKPYVVYTEAIRNNTRQSVGTVIIPKDTGPERQALRAQDTFNVWVVAVGAAITAGLALWLVVQELLGQSRKIPIEDALKVGESRTVEFKSTFQWDLRRNQFVEERRLDVLKSIAGFLNAHGGTLFIGVGEEANAHTLRGLDEDLAYVGGSRDKLQLTLRDLITTRIGPQFSPLIADGLGEDSGKLYWAVVVEESPEPAFVRWKPAGESKEQKKFYVREGPKTSDLDNESTWHYIKNRWG